MDLTSGLVIGRIRGIEIRVHWSWLLIFTLVSWALAQGLYESLFPDWTEAQRWAGGVVTSLFFFLSVLIHELSHAFVALGFKMRVPSITLFIFGGVSSIDGEMKSPGEEFKIAIAGPLASWALAVVFGAVAFAFDAAGMDLWQVAFYLAFINLILGAFNLLPGFPLDGGRVFRSIVWARTGNQLKATRIASMLGSGFAYLLIAFGIFWVLTVDLFGLWYVLIGFFLKSASDSAYAQSRVEHTLKDIPARDAMRPPPAPVSAADTLDRVVEDRVLGQAERALFVQDDGRIVGLVTTTDLIRIPRERWPSTRVSEAMVPSERVVVIAPDTRTMEAMRLMQEHDIHQVPVLDDGALVGLLTRGDILRLLELRAQFSFDLEGPIADQRPDEAKLRR